METTIITPSLNEFYDILEKHDWFYMMSDDSSKDRKGHAEERRIIEIVNSTRDQRYSDLYHKYHGHMWTGPAWNTERKPKPARPS